MNRIAPGAAHTHTHTCDVQRQSTGQYKQTDSQAARSTHRCRNRVDEKLLARKGIGMVGQLGVIALVAWPMVHLNENARLRCPAVDPPGLQHGW